MEKLKCGCMIKDGKFIVGQGCVYCLECNAAAEMHPFGEKRLKDLVE